MALLRGALIVAYYFPPENTSGAARPARFFRYLPEFGFDPVVVPLQRAQEFAQGGPIYGQQLTAKQLRERFGLGQ